jgi:hypothetical protein
LKNEAGRPAEGMASYDRDRTIRERLAREHPGSSEFARDLGRTWNNLAVIDLEQRRFDEARAKITRAVEWQRMALAATPDHPGYRRFLAIHLTDLIRAAEGLGRTDEAAEARGERDVLRNSGPPIVALDARLACVL